MKELFTYCLEDECNVFTDMFLSSREDKIHDSFEDYLKDYSDYNLEKSLKGTLDDYFDKFLWI